MSSLVLNQKLYAIRKKGTDLYLPDSMVEGEACLFSWALLIW